MCYVVRVGLLTSTVMKGRKICHVKELRRDISAVTIHSEHLSLSPLQSKDKFIPNSSVN